jgi:hypothetical protein
LAFRRIHENGNQSVKRLNWLAVKLPERKTRLWGSHHADKQWAYQQEGIRRETVAAGKIGFRQVLHGPVPANQFSGHQRVDTGRIKRGI